MYVAAAARVESHPDCFCFLLFPHCYIRQYKVLGESSTLSFITVISLRMCCKFTFCSDLLAASHHSFFAFALFQKQKPSAETSWNTFPAAGEERTDLKILRLVCVLGHEAAIKVSLVIQLNRWRRLLMCAHYKESKPK